MDRCKFEWKLLVVYCTAGEHNTYECTCGLFLITILLSDLFLTTGQVYSSLRNKCLCYIRAQHRVAEFVKASKHPINYHYRNYFVLSSPERVWVVNIYTAMLSTTLVPTEQVLMKLHSKILLQQYGSINCLCSSCSRTIILII